MTAGGVLAVLGLALFLCLIGVYNQLRRIADALTAARRDVQ